jgi:hypothetical protein
MQKKRVEETKARLGVRTAVLLMIGLAPTAARATPHSMTNPSIGNFSLVSAIGVADGVYAGSVTLGWSTSGAAICTLAMVSSINSLTTNVPCNETGLPVAIPINNQASPLAYTLTLTANGPSGTSPATSQPLSVYSLPYISYGNGGSQAFTSLHNIASNPPQQWGCTVGLGCWFQFGFDDCASVSPPTCPASQSVISVPSGTAKSSGIAIAGVVGEGFALASDQDPLSAQYGGFSGIPATYTLHLGVQSGTTLLMVQACGAAEGASATDYQAQVWDSMNFYYASPLQTNPPCFSLLSGAGGALFQSVIAYLLYLENLNTLTSDASTLANDVLNSTQASLSASSAPAAILNYLGALQAGNLGGGVTPVPVVAWNPAIPAQDTDTISVAPLGALATIGVAGTAQIALAQSNVIVSGVATPTTGSGASGPLEYITCPSNSIALLQTVSCTINLNAPAPAGGLSVALTSGSSGLSVPASVTISPNATTATFTMTAVSTGTIPTVIVTATAVSSSLTFSMSAPWGITAPTGLVATPH